MVEILICLFGGLELEFGDWIEVCVGGFLNFLSKMFIVVSLGLIWFFMRKGK